MNIGGVDKTSFVDYPGTLSCVLFTTGCNFRCTYCHNSHLFSARNTFTEQQALDFLNARKNFLEGVVISGGEPTLQSDLKEFIAKIKALGYLVKLDTNGTNFAVLKDLVENKLVDYVAMDIKAPMAKYENIVGETDKLSDVIKSRDYLKSCQIKTEFRTTFTRELTLTDMGEICKELQGANNFTIQKCNNVKNSGTNFERDKDDYFRALEIAKKHFKNVVLKGVD